MSNRNMSRLYQAGGGNTTVPEGLDPFGVKHRRQLETMELQNKLQQKLIDAEAAHEEALQKLKHEHDNDTITYKQASDYMSKNGLMDTSENRKATNDALFQQQLEGAKMMQQVLNQKAGNTLDANDTKKNIGLAEANQRGARAAGMGIDLNKFGNTTLPAGSQMVLPNIPGQPLDTVENKQPEKLLQLGHANALEAAREKQITEYMTKNNIMDTPQNRKAIDDALAQPQIQNAKQQTVNQYRGLMNAGGALDQDQNPNIRNANNVGANAAAMGLDLNKLNTTTPLGGTSIMPSIPGLGMNQIQGSTTKQEPMLYGGFYDKATGKMMDQKLGERNQMIPGRVITAPQMRPMSPNELPSNPNGPDGQSQRQLDSNGFFPTAGINNGGASAGVRNPPLSTMPQMSPSLSNGSFMNDEAERQNISPTPANQSPTTSGSALSPQWPPRSGLIPGGYDVIGTGLKQNWQQYRDMLSDPVWRFLMGGGQQPQQQLSTTPQY